MKSYIDEIVDLTGDGYLNPVGAAYGDGSGTHQRRVNQITAIAVHHDATDRPHDYDSVARYKSEAAGHYNRLGPGLQYHFKIDNTGVIFAIRPLTTWLYAVGSAANVTTLNICLDGNFEYQQPTLEQYEALKQLLDNLCTQHPEFPAVQANVYPHQQFSATACCGANLLPFVNEYRNTGGNPRIPAGAVYDWPEFQPQTAHTEPVEPAPAPAPVPQTTPAPVVVPTPSPAPTEPVPVVVAPAPAPTPTPTPLPNRDSATGRGLHTALQTGLALAGAALLDPSLLVLLNKFAPGFVYYLPVATGVVSFLVNFFRVDVKNY